MARLVIPAKEIEHMTNEYTKSFHDHLHQKTQHAAEVVSGLVMQMFPQIQSVVDVGCGLGTWLNAFATRGVRTVEGLDGSWVNRNNLKIPAACFHETDLNGELELAGHYDLAICLEAAEHVRESSADRLVEFLTSKANIVLFSAAIPGQHGPMHINEQWPSYWVGKFKLCGFEVGDVLRGTIWNDASIPYWYRQNLLLLVHGSARQIVVNRAREAPAPLDIVHPYLFLERTSPPTTLQALALLTDAVKKSIRTRCLGKNA